MRLITWLNDLDDGTKQAIVTVGLFAAAIGPATWALGTPSRIGRLPDHPLSDLSGIDYRRDDCDERVHGRHHGQPDRARHHGVTTLGAVAPPTDRVHERRDQGAGRV